MEPTTQDIVNCTFVANTSSQSGAAIQAANATLTVVNSIFWQNKVKLVDQPIAVTGAGSATVSYSLIDPVAWPSARNFLSDPLFADPAAGDYRLLRGSPCIDRGDNSAVTSAMDIEGDDRVIDGGASNTGTTPTVDVGADEYRP
jgi:predicted outer membrane repeat protein